MREFDYSVLPALRAVAEAAQAEAPGPWRWDHEFPHDLVTDSERNVLHLGHIDKRMRPAYAHIAAFSPAVALALLERVGELERGECAPCRACGDRIAQLEQGLGDMLDRVSKALEMPYEPMFLLADPDTSPDVQDGMERLRSSIAQLRALAEGRRT